MLATKLLVLTLIFVSSFALELSPRQVATPFSRPESLHLKQTPLSCSSYMCLPVNSSIPMAPNACIHFQNNTYYLQSCFNRTDGHSFCNTNDDPTVGDNYCQLPATPSTGNVWPGEICTSNLSCISGNCNNSTKRCVGFQVNSQCFYSGNCDSGLFCSSGVCLPQQTQGGSCATDSDCQNWLGCNSTSLLVGTCVPYYSVAVNNYVSDCYSEATSYFCASGTCKQTNSNGAGICINPIKSVAMLPQQCYSDVDCVGSAGIGLDFTSVCNCGYNPQAAAYCQPFIGDSPGQSALSAWKAVMTNQATATCNTMRRFTNNCLQSVSKSGAMTAAVSNLYYLYYPELQGNDNCVKYIYTNYYWSMASASSLSVFFLSLLLVLE